MKVLKILVSHPILVVTIAVFYFGRGTTIPTVAAVALLLIAGFQVVRTLHHIRVVKRYFSDVWGLQSEQLAQLRVMTGDLFSNTRTFTYSRANGALVVIGIPYACIALFLGLNWWALPVYLIAQLWVVAYRQLTPPVAVFLSASEVDQVKLCGDIQRRIFPLRVVNLLSLSAVRDVRRSYVGAGMRKLSETGLVAYDGNRLLRTEGWEKTVENILVPTPLIIVDLRIPSEQLEVECGIVNRLGLHWKLVAIHGGDEPVAKLERRVFSGGGARPGDIAWLRADEAPKTVVHSIALGKRFPSETRPAGRLLVPPAHDYKEWNYIWPEDSA